MPEFIKAHAREYLMVIAVANVLLQVVVGSGFDLLLDAALLGCVWIATRLGRS
jgi:hypothetical protein